MALTRIETAALQSSITGSNITDGSIAAADLASGSVTPAKLSTGGPNWDSSSNLAIGHSSPDRPVHLKSSGSRNYIKAETTVTSNSNEAGFEVKTPVANFLIGSLGNTNALWVYDVNAAAERLRIDAAGNLGLGVTPSAWNSIYKAFQIGSVGRSLAQTGAGSGDWTLAFNAIYSSANSRWDYAYTGDAAVRYSQTGAGIHAWYTAASGTAGNAITFTQAMTLDASGNLLVGTTSTRSSAKLDIRGNVIALGENATYYGTIDYSAGTGFLSLTAESAGGIKFLAGTTERMRIASNGNVAIGTSETGVAKVNIQLAGTAISGDTTGVAMGAGAIFQLNNPNHATTNSTILLLGGGTSSTVGQISSGIGFSRENENDWGTQLRFYTHNTATDVLSTLKERMRIDSSGNFLVGVTSGSYHTLAKDIAGNFATEIRNSNANPYGLYIRYSGAASNGSVNEFLYCGDTVGQKMSIRSNGGIANYSGSNVNLSDRREKTNFAPAKSYLDVICAIPVQTFNYIDQNMEDDGGLTLGVVAQDVQAVAPELVMESNWAGKDEEPKMRLSIYQTDLQYALMKCIQELKTENDSLKARLDAAGL